MSKQKINYTNALAELEEILTEFEDNTEMDMEYISGKVKRAAELLRVCKKQLYEIDEELEKMLEELE